MTDEAEVPPKAAGYKKPPVHGQFKKGQSGNPSGRKKGAFTFASEVKKALETPVTINENGKKRKITTQKAILLRTIQLALNGNPRAGQQMLGLSERHNTEAHAQHLDREARSAKDQIIIDEAQKAKDSRERRLKGTAADEPGAGCPKRTAPEGLNNG